MATAITSIAARFPLPVAHYEVMERLGEGGMGVVYKARDLYLDRPVALKFLPENPRNCTEAVARLREEARAISALNHPNIATIHEVNESDGRPFLVLEYLSGGSLRSRVKAAKNSGRKLSMAEILEYGLQVGEGLSHAHRHDIIHRDVKADNVLFTEEGVAKLTDFGLAKRPQSEPVTRDGVAVGTVTYMSPEQAQGKEVDHRTDIYSFGVVLYEMATGQVPFPSSNEASVLYQIVHRQLPPITTMRTDLPAAFERILYRALEKDPDRRYQSMDQVLADLRALRRMLQAGPQAGELGIASDHERTVTLGHQVGARRAFANPLLAGLAVLGVVLAAAAVGTRNWLPGDPLNGRKQIAVLPFENIGREPANQVFCEGTAETLTSMLTQLEGFQDAVSVIPSSDLRRESVTSAGDAKRKFHADLAVTGSIQRADNRVRLTLNLVDAHSLRQLRAETMTIPLDELANIPDWALNTLAGMLQVTLRPQARELVMQGRTTMPGAYDFYVQAVGYLRRFDKLENLNNAIAVFQRALQLDPKYAQAYAGLGEAFWRKYRQTREPGLMEDAQANCRRAVGLNDRLPAAHVTMGAVQQQRGRYPDAIHSFQKALKLDTYNADAYLGLAATYDAMGRVTEAENTYSRSIRLRPGYWAGYNHLAGFYFNHGKYAAAEPLYRRVIELTPDNSLGHRNLGALYTRVGRYPEAVVELNRSLALQPSASAYSHLGTALYYQHRFGDAVAPMEKAAELGESNYMMWGNLADTYRWAPGRAGEAPHAYRKAAELARQDLRINTENAAAMSSLAVYETFLERRGDALHHIAKACGLDPANVNVLFKSARVYEANGQRIKAIAALTDALDHGYPVEEVRRDPDMESLRADARSQPLFRR